MVEDAEGKEAVSLQVGQRLWFVPKDTRFRKPNWVEIEKIGRKWATLGRNAGRVDMNTLYLDGQGYTSPGRCYLSEEEWQDAQRAEDVWRRFVQQINYGRRPRAATVQQIEQAAALLGIELNGVAS